MACFSLCAALVTTVFGQAQECGSAEAPCNVENGTYHITLPETDKIQGIVMYLHGGGATGAAMMSSGLAEEAHARGYVFVAPNGEQPENRWTKDWSVRADNMSFTRNDATFLASVLADARQRSGVMDGPVLLAGFSRGGSMVWNMACHIPDFATAYAPSQARFGRRCPTNVQALCGSFTPMDGQTEPFLWRGEASLTALSRKAMFGLPLTFCAKQTAVPTANRTAPVSMAVSVCVTGRSALQDRFICFCTKADTAHPKAGPKR